MKENGFRVKVLEGRKRIGGRMFTEPSTGFDLGASWIHGIEGNPIAQIAKENSIPLILSYFREQFFEKDGKLVPNEVS